MTYLAPRQGLFAIIILVSFCLQTLLLVISTDHQLTKSRAQKGEQMIAQLIEEVRLPLENKDRVSLSVIANRYSSEQDVARLLIKDNNDDILVPLGNAPMHQGVTIRKVATNGDAVIGSIALTLKDISKGEIITMQWPFVISSLILHLFLWLLYGYVARPTKEQINALSRDIRDMHRAHDMQYGQIGNEEDADNVRIDNISSDSKVSNTNTVNNDNPSQRSDINTNDVHNDLKAYVKSQQSIDISLAQGRSGDVVEADKVPQSAATYESANRSANVPSRLSANRSFDSVNVHIMFQDEFNMLNLLSPEMQTSYFALCSQLFNQALSELLQQPLLLGVTSDNTPSFNKSGAVAVLKADNDHAKLALAGVMLGKLYLMLNKIIHDKHIELNSFALPIKAGVSDSDQANAMSQLLKNNAKKEQLFILLPNVGLKQIVTHIQVHSLERPTTVYERECVVFDGANDTIIQRLTDTRNTVLTADIED